MVRWCALKLTSEILTCCSRPDPFWLGTLLILLQIGDDEYVAALASVIQQNERTKIKSLYWKVLWQMPIMAD